ncbi:MAG: recombinase family protein [Caulobacterales bacterium]|nr:recombinase family protein [Caulobacterales bacterium]
MVTNSTKNIGIWLRVSTEDQVKGESLDVHEHRARSYAESKDWTVKEIYRLEAVSGKQVIDHPEAVRMLSDIQSGAISGLIFSKLARLSRNNRELLQFADIFQKHNADLISLAESIDTSTPAGRMFYNMLAAMANWEREEISARVQASIPIRAKMGRSLGGQAPYGYKWEDKKLVVEPNEAPIRLLLYTLFKEHKRRKTVARLLNDMGHRTRTGARWSDTSVTRLLQDTSAKGTKKVNYTKQGERGKGWIEKPESEWVYTEIEPIVSEELWNDVNDELRNQRLTGKRQSRASVTLFGGKAFCSCGSKMYVKYGTSKYTCTKCKRKIPIQVLEECFNEELKKQVFSKDDLGASKTQKKTAINELEILMDNQKETIRKIDRDIDSLLSLYQSGSIDERGFKSRYDSLGKRHKELCESIPQVETKLSGLRKSLESNTVLLRESQNIATEFPKLPMTERRLIVEILLDTVTVHEDEIVFSLLFTPSKQAKPSVSPTPPSGSDGNRATLPHGFIAATN